MCLCLAVDALGGGGQGIKAWAAAVGLMECHAEVAGAGVAYFQGDLGDVEASFPEEIGGALHAQPAKVLEDGLSRFLGKDAAEMKMAAADALADGFQGWGLGDVLLEQGDDFLDPLLIEQLLGLLVVFIGEALTLRLVHEVWPRAASQDPKSGAK